MILLEEQDSQVCYPERAIEHALIRQVDRSSEELYFRVRIVIAETCTAVVAMFGGLDRMRAGLLIENPAGQVLCVWLCAIL